MNNIWEISIFIESLNETKILCNILLFADDVQVIKMKIVTKFGG